MFKIDKRNIIGWFAIIVSVLVAGFWADWGIVENFHEGWYSTNLFFNLELMFVQYLSAAIIFTIVSLLALYRPRVGGAIFIIFGCIIFIVWLLRYSNRGYGVILDIIAALIVLGLLYFFGRAKPRKIATILLILIPLVIILALGTPAALRVASRINDGDFGARLIRGNGVSLVWAPRGPGFPEKGVGWQAAIDACKHLSDDGSALVAGEQNVWRLPMVEEIVRSEVVHGTNVQGVFDRSKMDATYKNMPDKETPLWDDHSEVIYYWSAEQKDSGNAYTVAYNGYIYDHPKIQGDYVSHRCVKDYDQQN